MNPKPHGQQARLCLATHLPVGAQAPGHSESLSVHISGTQAQPLRLQGPARPGQPEPQALAQTSGMKLGPGGRHARSAIQAGSLDSAPKADVPLARLWPATQWHSQPDSGSPSRSWHSRTPVAGSRR